MDGGDPKHEQIDTVAGPTTGYAPAPQSKKEGRIASKKGVALSELANDLLKKEIAILETVK